MSDALWMNAGKETPAIGTATIAASTDLLALTAHGLANGDTVTVDTLTGGAVGVLVPDAVYFVRDASIDGLGLSLTPAGPLVLFAADGGAAVYRYAPQYNAQELRRAQSMLLTSGGNANAFDARQGLHPFGGADRVTLAGSTITVGPLKAVVYPGLTALSGPYLVALPQEQHTLAPADGTNARIDTVDLQVLDHDEDAAGFRRARSVYTPGTPAGSPVAPPLTATSFRMATIPVPAGGSPAPTVELVYDFTVAAGGIIPVRDAAGLPSSGRYESLYVDQRDTDALRRWNGSGWETVASAFVHANAGVVLQTFNAGAGTNVTTVFNDIDPSYQHLQIIWRGRNDSTNQFASLSMRFNGANGATDYFSMAVNGFGSAWDFVGDINSSSLRVGTTGSQIGTHGVIWIPTYSGNGTKSAHGTSHARGGNGFVANNGWSGGAGYWTGTAPITSIQLWPTGQLWGGNISASLIGWK